MGEEDFDANVESIKNDYLLPAITKLPHDDGDIKDTIIYLLFWNALLMCKNVSQDENEVAAQYYMDIADGVLEHFLENTDLTAYLPKKE